LKGHGFVGVGTVPKQAVSVYEFNFKNQPLRTYPLIEERIFLNEENEKVEFLVAVKWNKAFNREDAKWARNKGLFTTQLIKASLINHVKTIQFLERSFRLSFESFRKKLV